MNDTIICPHCKKPIPLTEALSHQIQEKYQRFYKQRLAEETGKIEIKLKDQLIKKVKQEMELELKDKANELEELHKQNKSLQEQLLELSKLIRQLRAESQQKQIELEKKLAVEQERIHSEEKKRADEEYRLKILEKDKKLSDALKLAEEYKKKLEQGSQQLQGEVLELELEKILKEEFPTDDIKEVPKGIRGADVIQIIRNGFGKACGTIIWELKRTKSWSNDWIVKLKDDQRRVKAEQAVIISEVLPENIQNFGFQEGVWIGNFPSIIGLSLVIRRLLVEISGVKSASVGKRGKMDILWEYLTGTEFKQRVEAIAEAFSTIQEDIEKEKRWFVNKWSKQEKSLRKVIDNTLGMHGDLQGIVGKSLPEIKGLDMLPDGENKKDKLF
ncbi:DUF2130 domain-containing protein [Candidatus Roizmanbacteria bacterium CG02_land_8_20_14_3_00_36_15]|uniref:DUF2130 domain-containing protein n=2 Tax=Candidatus Roizmaniibacteriota TaxID=1752723 RepID=A0A2M8KLK8_9BACT|nr:MAG: DUF2130 domain-containing protein [Candidatus Roizmanbacteria bacterium CG03_land_8_20_14_0_80_36_21]PIV37686.1 MAG: DUF2130 domain-containing protein [Candidatus Roizmanbacteria bacterium CG02_land_8_20_14_3_00_36_15]PIY69643.1 MAG: DUF2130 domain-containing protein [Candidatus Roizmanbacteria bacterium CG_4_10_14_0_8_um_filter_36_36]PJA53515.1 MAG: DUF2130 domain-containing protein [Candidatus Roizmanbacteria bacterium CG_4_9_14_3_um_filter_36_11]PJC82153.1 MAG: DUF2130 domain-contain